MAIKTVTSKAGKEYNADSPEGKMITNMGASKSSVDKGSSLGATAIVKSLRSEFKGLNAHLAFRFEDIKKAILGTPAEQRDERIASENTDKDPDKGGSESSGDKKGFMETLKGLNPFTGGIGTKTGILLLAGTLFAISKFGDKLVKPLASVLEQIDKDGGILDKFKDTEFFKGAVLAFEKIKARAKLIAEDIEKLLAAVVRVATVINDAFVKVDEYIATFDKDGEEGLSQSERADLFDDMKSRAVSAISGFMGDIMLSIGGMLLSATFITKTAGLAFAAIKPIFAAKSFIGPMPLGAAAAGAGAASLIPIAGMLLYGVTTTWSNISNSIKDTIEEEGSFSFSGFFANFFGGDDKGGFMNAMRQAFKLGGTFALAGMAIGAIAGVGFLSIPGALIGGVIGMGVGLLVGAVTGALGSDRIKKFTSGLGEMVANVIDTIGDFFSNVIAGFKSFFAGEGFGKGYNDSRYADKSEAESDLLDIQDEIAALEAEKAAFKAKSPNAVFFNQKKLDKKIEKAADLELTIHDAPQHQINRNRRLQEESQLQGAERIEALEKSKAYNPTLFMQGNRKTPLQLELEELYESQREGSIALQKMAANKDTLRTTLIKDKQKLEDLKNAELRKQNRILNSKYDATPIAPLTVISGAGGGQGSGGNNYIENNYGSRFNVDNGFETPRVLQIDGFRF